MRCRFQLTQGLSQASSTVDFTAHTIQSNEYTTTEPSRSFSFGIYLYVDRRIAKVHRQQLCPSRLSES